MEEKKQEEYKMPKLDIGSLNDVVMKQDDIMSVASSKVGTILLPDGMSSSAMKHFIHRVGENVTEYKVGDELMAYNRQPNIQFEWKDPITKEIKLVTKTDKYNIDLAIRKDG